MPRILKIEKIVNDCQDCPMRRSHSGHGECWDFCAHEKAPGVYENIINGCQEKFKGTPQWCPLEIVGAKAAK